MSAFWRGVLSIFDLGGVLYREDPPEQPQRPDERTDAEKDAAALRRDAEQLEIDWRKFVRW